MRGLVGRRSETEVRKPEFTVPVADEPSDLAAAEVKEGRSLRPVSRGRNMLGRTCDLIGAFPLDPAGAPDLPEGH
jgi:hypothetical protein